MKTGLLFLFAARLGQDFRQAPRPSVPGVEFEGFLGGLFGFFGAAEGLEELGFAPPGTGGAGGAAFEGFPEDLVQGGQAFGSVATADGGDLALL